MNAFKTGILLISMTVLLVAIGSFFGPQGLYIALVFAVVMNFVSYWWSDKIVLAMYRAKEVRREQAPEVYGAVEELVQANGMPMPRVYIIPSASPNAFGTGRSPHHAAVAVTEGIMDILNRDELRGVIAHELAHVRNRDILTATVVAVLAGTVMMLAFMLRWGAILGGDDDRNPIGLVAMLVVSILAPIAAIFIQMWISRTREYAADETGARMAGSGHALANALRKLHTGSQRATLKANAITAHMFIVNPLSAKGMARRFSTHPPVEDRIAKLEKMQF